jgi:hypothetical protein
MIDFGQGDEQHDSNSLFINEARYIDLAQELTRGQASYCDFEGLTSGTSTEAMLNRPEIVALFKPGEREPFTRDLLAHWYYQNIDEGGYTPSTDECIQFVFVMDWLFTSRYRMKIDAQEVS